MKAPRYSFVHQARMMFAAALLSAGVVTIMLGWFDPLGFEQRRIDESSRRATRIVLCNQLLTYEDRLKQLQATIDDVGLTGLTRNERDVWDSVSRAAGRLRTAEAVLRVDCIPGD